MGLFGKPKAPAPTTSTGAGVADAPPRVPGLPAGPPPRPAGPVVTSVADWRVVCQQQREALVASVSALLATCTDDIAATRTDTAWIDRRFLALDRQAEGAATLVRNTWSRLLDRGAAPALELDRATLDITLVREHGHRWLRAQAAHAMMNFALYQDARTRFCGGCGASLGPLLVSQAHEIRCAACGRLQLVEPGQAFRLFASFAARWVGEGDGFPQYAAVRHLELEIDAERDTSRVPLELLRSYHQASAQYVSTVLVVEGMLVPEHQPHMPLQHRALMVDANRRLSRFWQWREQAPSDLP